MFRLKKCVIFMITTALLLSGCAAKETMPENPSREVTVEKRTSKSGLPEEEWKESNVSYEDMPVEFQDTVVEAVLRDKIGKTEGEVYISELQKVHAISINGEQPHNLNDLSYCYNLQRLTFSDINIPSLEPLAVLPQLEELSFSVGTNVTEQVLEEIGKLPVLKDIHIGTGEFTDWGKLTDGSFLLPLADQLTELCAMGNIAWNPEVLAQMTKLETLKIENAEDISFLKQLIELKKLYLYCCTPKDWSPLSFLEDLEHLEIGGNMYTTVAIKLEDLLSLEKLDYLCLSFTSINTECSYQEVVDALPSLTGYHVH